MATKVNPNQALIDEVIDLEKRITQLSPADGYVAIARGAAITIRDHLTWHGETQVERAQAELAQAEEKAAAESKRLAEARALVAAAEGKSPAPNA